MTKFLIDTQLLSSAWSADRPLADHYISSVIAKEFLEMYQSESPRLDKYYVPVLTHSAYSEFGISVGSKEFRERNPSRNRCDKFSVSFASDRPEIIEYGSKAIALTINQGRFQAYRWATQHLSKAMRQRIRSRFDYIVKNRIVCSPLIAPVVHIALELLWDFSQAHNVKKDFRNSFNDMLILATSKHYDIPLLTNDTLLARFAVDKYKGRLQVNDEAAVVDFPRESVGRVVRKESKGYINHGWRIGVEISRT